MFSIWETVNDLINLVSYILGYHVLTVVRMRAFNRRKTLFLELSDLRYTARVSCALIIWWSGLQSSWSNNARYGDQHGSNSKYPDSSEKVVNYV
jgi:hypothetical protein